MRVYISLAVFLFSALALIIPSGYAAGALLLVAGTFTLLRGRGSFVLQRDDLLLMTALGGYFTAHVVLNLVQGAKGTEYDAPLRFLLAIPVLLLLLRTPPKAVFFWSGLAVGGIGAGLYAGWETMIMGIDRAGGSTNPIQYGNISLLLGVLSLSGLGWAVQQARAKVWVCLMLAGATLGLIGSLLTGSRGSWVALPVVLIALGWSYRNLLTRRHAMVAVAVLSASMVAVAVSPRSDLISRLQLAFTEANGYLQSKDLPQSSGAGTSVGARLEMWRMGLIMAPQHPFIGWGKSGYMEEAARLAEQGIVHPVVRQHSHLHNGYLDALVKRGIIGLVSMLMLHGVSIVVFTRHLRHASSAAKPYAAAGLLLPLCYLTFDATQAFLGHINGVMMLTFLTVMLWSQLRHQET